MPASAAALAPVSRRLLSDAVFDRLCGSILSGQLAPGDSLPAERELAATLEVNRNALREALKRLQQLRLIAIQAGGSTRVLDFRRSAGLDLLPTLLLAGPPALTLAAARSLVELRTALGPDIAGHAAERGGPAATDQLTAAAAALRAIPTGDLVARQRKSVELWRLLVAVSDNLAYQLAFNTMEQGWSAIQDLAAPALAAELTNQTGYDRLVRAVQRGDGSAARRLARRLVEAGQSGLIAALARAQPAARRSRS